MKTGSRQHPPAQQPATLNLCAGLPRLFKPGEVSVLLGVGVRTLELWRQTGDGPRFVKLGPKLIRYREEDLAMFLSKAVQTNTC